MSHSVSSRSLYAATTGVTHAKLAHGRSPAVPAALRQPSHGVERMKRLASCLMILLAAATVADAEVVKMAVPSDSGLRLYWWPALPIPKGWQHDDEVSREREVNVILPIGKSFDDAPAVIYARADYKPRLPQVHSLADYIHQDKADIGSQSPTAAIADRPDVKTGDGATLKVVSYALPAKRQWELVAYGEEGDYYVLFTVSAATDTDLKDAESVFYGLLARYKK
jgi:hypothetical protein